MKLVVVIADAGPLIALARIGHIHLLREIFTEVVMTETVQQEVLSGGDFAESVLIEDAILEGWLQVWVSPNTMAGTDLEWLDPGERSSILLALDYQQNGQTPRLVIDEAKGRAAAKSLSLELIGSAGIIATASRLGLIPLAHPLLQHLRASGYYLSQTVIETALNVAGENEKMGF
jgi:predicted nucleic acid-binding protein